MVTVGETMLQLFNRSEAVESWFLAVVAVHREQTEGEIGGRFLRYNLWTVASGNTCLDDPCSFSVLCRSCVSRSPTTQKQVHLEAIAVVCFVKIAAVSVDHVSR